MITQRVLPIKSFNIIGTYPNKPDDIIDYEVTGEVYCNFGIYQYTNPDIEKYGMFVCIHIPTGLDVGCFINRETTIRYAKAITKADVPTKWDSIDIKELEKNQNVCNLIYIQVLQ